MEKKFHMFHGEDNQSSSNEVENSVDEAVASARDVCLTNSNIAVKQAFFMTSGFSPVYFAFSLQR